MLIFIFSNIFNPCTSSSDGGDMQRRLQHPPLFTGRQVLLEGGDNKDTKIK
jgi:hypothetical protein